MAVSFDLPADLEKTLRQRDPNLDKTSRDAFLVAQYRAGTMSIGDIALALGLETRFEAEQWLGERNVVWNYALQDLENDRATLDRILGPAR